MSANETGRRDRFESYPLFLLTVKRKFSTHTQKKEREVKSDSINTSVDRPIAHNIAVSTGVHPLFTNPSDESSRSENRNTGSLNSFTP